jgi:hypothetical protein
MKAREKNRQLAERLRARGIPATLEDADTLRLAQITLHRWAELECGNGNDHASWAIERDETTDIPYMVTYPHNSNTSRRHRIPDRETGALRRVKALCDRLGVYCYHQTDPRGCALYVGAEPLTDANYCYGVACCE